MHEGAKVLSNHALQFCLEGVMVHLDVSSLMAVVDKKSLPLFVLLQAFREQVKLGSVLLICELLRDPF